MCIVSFCGSIKQSTLCCWHKPQSKPTEMLLLFGYGWSLIDQIPDIWSIRGSSSTKTKAFLVLVDAVAKIFLLFRPTQRIMTCNAPQLQLAWYLVEAVEKFFKYHQRFHTKMCLYVRTGSPVRHITGSC